MSDHGDGDDVDDGGDGVHAPIWMISFADMLLLMVSFFLIMALINDSKGAKGEVDPEVLRIVASLKLGFGYVPDPKSQEPLDLAALQLLEARDQNESTPFRNPLISNRSKKSSDERQDQFVKLKSPLGQPILFKQDEDTLLNPVGVQETRLRQIADLARPHVREIIIHGHCSKSEAGGEDRGFSLAYDRARFLKDRLSRLGIAPERIRLVSCSYFSPYPRANTSEKDKTDKQEPQESGTETENDSNLQPDKISPEQMNRRVEVTLGTYFLPTHGSRSGN